MGIELFPIFFGIEKGLAVGDYILVNMPDTKHMLRV